MRQPIVRPHRRSKTRSVNSVFHQVLDALLGPGLRLPAGARSAAAQSLQRYSNAIAENILGDAIAAFFEGIASIDKTRQEVRQPETPNTKPETVTVGDTPATVRAKILDVLKPFGTAPELADALNLDFKIKVATQVSAGAGRFVADQTNVDEYPAWELKRVYDREVPRGEEPQHPSDPWPVRWMHAAELVDEGELLVSILKDTGRMIALKSSDIWQALGDGAGGYDDALGNPFAPFAFNSGFDTEGVSRSECYDLGLLAREQAPRPATYDYAQLISLPKAA